MIEFNHKAYCAAVAQNVYYALQDTLIELETQIAAQVLNIKMSKLDRKQKRSPGGIVAGMRRHHKLWDSTMRQGGRMLGSVSTGTTKDSVVALFYEYGTGETSEMPLGRWEHLDPNPMAEPNMIVGRPTKGEKPRGRKTKGETYQVISYGGGVLTHTTRGRKAGKRLKELEVPAYHFMSEGLAITTPILRGNIIRAIEAVPVKPFFKFKSVKVR